MNITYYSTLILIGSTYLTSPAILAILQIYAKKIPKDIVICLEKKGYIEK